LREDRDRWRAEAEALAREGRELRATRRYRLAGALVRPLDALRGTRR
jgi:hypothetical protein